MAYVICEPCIDVKDKACLPTCPCDCIIEGDRQMYIDPEVCIDCAACFEACPTQAIFLDAEVPEHWRLFIELNGRMTGKTG